MFRLGFSSSLQKVTQRFTNILFVAHSMTDDSAAFKQALRLAHENQAQLSVVSVVAAPKLHSSDANKTVNDQLVANRREELDAFVQAPTPKGETVERKLLVGKTFVEIIREALRSDHDLVVKSIEPKEYGDHLGFSTTDKKLMRKCPCPVWLIKSTQQSGFREILVGVDYELDNAENDALNRQLLELSASLAIADFSELHVVHAWRLEHEGFLRGPRTGHSNDEVDAMLEDDKQLRQRWLTTIVADCCESLGQGSRRIPQAPTSPVAWRCEKCRSTVCQGPWRGTCCARNRCSHRSFRPCDGEYSSLLDQIDCSVLAVKPSGFISPIALD